MLDTIPGLCYTIFRKRKGAEIMEYAVFMKDVYGENELIMFKSFKDFHNWFLTLNKTNFKRYGYELIANNMIQITEGV